MGANLVTIGNARVRPQHIDATHLIKKSEGSAFPYDLGIQLSSGQVLYFHYEDKERALSEESRIWDKRDWYVSKKHIIVGNSTISKDAIISTNILYEKDRYDIHLYLSNGNKVIVNAYTQDNAETLCDKIWNGVQETKIHSTITRVHPLDCDIKDCSCKEETP